MTKRALISVWNKDKLVEFATELTQKYDYEIVATGSTYDLLKENNIQAKEITEITGKRQLINGKVKTLYPDVFAGILADMNNADEKADIEIKNLKAHFNNEYFKIFIETSISKIVGEES